MTRYSLEPRNYLTNMGKNLLDTAAKTASKKLVQKTAEAIK